MMAEHKETLPIHKSPSYLHRFEHWRRPTTVSLRSFTWIVFFFEFTELQNYNTKMSRGEM